MGDGIPIKLKWVAINELLEDAITTMGRSDSDRQIALRRCNVSTAHWDYERLHQTLINLLVNALKHSPKDSTVDLHTDATESDITLEVSKVNRAGPIPLDVQKSLFEPFKRFVADGVNSKGSIGLGLYIVDQIVKGHRGRSEVESDSISTRFRLILPRGPPK